MEKSKLFLDLEDTIIESWGNPHLINVQKIKHFIDTKCPKIECLHIFSFAIYNDPDKLAFTISCQQQIERALGLPVVEWLSVLEMMELSRLWTGLRWPDVTDFIQCRGKHYAFFDVMQQREKDCTCILLDDGVPHMNTLMVPSKGLVLQLVNIDKL